MARQKGIIKIKGTMGDITFFKSKDGYMVKEKSAIEASRIATDPKFKRTRENGAEFGISTQAGKTLRDAIRPLLKNSADNRVVSRLVKVMTIIKNMDTFSARGERNVAMGIGSPAAKGLLKGFNFNILSILGTVLFKPYTVVAATGEINIPGVIPINDVVYPPGATHVSFRSAWARIDFANKQAETFVSPVTNLPLDGVMTHVKLIPAGMPAIVGTDIYLLQLEFFQEVNGVQYTLSNGAFNAMQIVEVG